MRREESEAIEAANATPEQIAHVKAQALRLGQTHTLEVSRIDATLVEALSEATLRSGDLQLAIQGFALTLRLRAATNYWVERRESDRRNESVT